MGDSERVYIDALPYFDAGYDEPGVREAALALIDEECRRYRPTKNYLDHLPLIDTSKFETEVFRTEMERVAARQPMELLNMKRCELPGPPAGQKSDLGAWAESLRNSQAQLEHQSTRLVNLNLLARYGTNAWKTYCSYLESLVDQLQKQHTTIRSSIQEINWERKSEQQDAGSRLTALEAEFTSLVDSNFRLEDVCQQMESRASSLRAEEASFREMSEHMAKEAEKKRRQVENQMESAEREEKRKIGAEQRQRRNEMRVHKQLESQNDGFIDDDEAKEVPERMDES